MLHVSEEEQANCFELLKNYVDGLLVETKLLHRREEYCLEHEVVEVRDLYKLIEISHLLVQFISVLVEEIHCEFR